MSIIDAINQLIKHQPFMAWAGVTCTAAEVGFIELTMPIRPDHLQHTGAVHAGVISGLADNAAGACAATTVPRDKTIVAVEFKINLLAQAKGSRLIARARVPKAGRTMVISTVEVFTESDDGQAPALCALLQGSYMGIAVGPSA